MGRWPGWLVVRLPDLGGWLSRGRRPSWRPVAIWVDRGVARFVELEVGMPVAALHLRGEQERASMVVGIVPHTVTLTASAVAWNRLDRVGDQ